MAFESIKKVGRSVKDFCREHIKEITLVTGAIAFTGAVCYGMRKTANDSHGNERELLTNLDKSNTDDIVAWKKEWSEYATELEHTTHQPWGDLTKDDEDYVDPLEGNCFIVAGYNSLYNESSDQLKFYVLDDEGVFHPFPDDVYSA